MHKLLLEWQHTEKCEHRLNPAWPECLCYTRALERELVRLRAAPTDADMEWLHKFINCVPFGAHAPVEDIQRAHEIVAREHRLRGEAEHWKGDFVEACRQRDEAQEQLRIESEANDMLGRERDAFQAATERSRAELAQAQEQARQAMSLLRDLSDAWAGYINDHANEIIVDKYYEAARDFLAARAEHGGEHG